MSSHLDWCRQRILSVKPEDPATAGIPAQEVCDVIYSMCRVCVCVCHVCVCHVCVREIERPTCLTRRRNTSPKKNVLGNGHGAKGGGGVRDTVIVLF